tara:strand:- start:632 stop:2206 length:1575 start_codon:yes stop_codon:yes gene_type:complete
MADKNINIKVRATGAEKAKQQLGGLSGSITKMGKAVGIASAAYFGAKGLINSMSKVIELAGIQEQAEKRLETALGRTSQALLNQASALQKVTTFGDESIIGVQASIAAFVDSEEAIKKATEATLDIAVAMGMDLKSAGDLVAKTLGSSTNAMSRYGIEVEGAVGSTERLESLTNNVANLFGGQAKAQAETMAGALDQAGNSAGDLAEAIGNKLSPFVTDLALGFTDTTSALTELINLTNQTKSATLIYYETIEEAESVLKKYSESLGITTDESLSLSDQILQLREESEKLKEDDFFQGVWVSEAARALRDTRGLVEDLDISLQNFRATALPDDRPITIIDPHEPELLGDLIINMEEMNDLMNESFGINEAVKKQKQEMLIQDLKSAALSGQSAKNAMKSVVRAESMEAVSGYIASVLKSVPFPLNIGLAAGGGALVAGLIDKGLSNFATGGDFVTSGPQMIMVGDNPGGQERVQVTPLSSPNINGPQGGVTVNISAPLVDQTVVDSILPAIQSALREDRAALDI